MSQGSSARVFWATAVPFGVAMAVFRMGHMPTGYAVSIGVVLGSLFGGAAVWMQKRAELRLEAQGIDPSDLAPVQERSEEIPADLASVYQASRNALLKL